MRLYPLGLWLMTASLLSSCGWIYTEPAPNIVNILVSCPRCSTATLCSLSMNQDGLRSSFVLEGSNHSASIMPLRTTNSSQGIWFSHQEYPLRPVARFHDGGEYPSVELEPIPRIPHILEDTALTIRFQDSLPQPVRWEIRTYGQYAYSFTLDTLLLPDPLSSSATLRIPRRLLYPAVLGSAVTYGYQYRGAHLGSHDTLTDRSLVCSWPPIDTINRGLEMGYAKYSCWVDSLFSGQLRTTCIERVPNGGYRFHRSMARGGSRISEDSGFWDSVTNTARFVRRSPGKSQQEDSSLFRPLDLSGAYWFRAAPAQEWAARKNSERLPWRFFPEPSLP